MPVKPFRFSLLLLGLTISLSQISLADQVIINNNNGSTQNPEQAPAPCGANNNSQGDMRPGTYEVERSNGSIDTVYSTGDKQPYIVDNNCNQQPIIQPYVYTQPPGLQPGPFPPRPMPRR